MLDRLLAPHAERAFAFLRLVVGFAFAFHGVRKVFGVLAERVLEVGSQLWIGGVLELTTGILIAVGLFANWAAFLASGTMAVAYIQFHWKLQVGAALLPAINGGELALIYCLLFLFLACRGPGRFSIDHARGAGAR